MALSSLIVKIGADMSDLNKGVGEAERIVDHFGKKTATIGRSVSRMGDRVSIAANSFQRLAGVMPGVSANTVSMISVLGTASVVLGETAVLSTGLTKAWRLLTVVSAQLATTLPAALAPLLGNPITLALVGVGLLTAAVLGLKSAWSGAGKAATTAAANSEFFMTPEGFREKFFKAQAQGDAGTAFEKAGTLANSVIEEWRQAVSGVRPLTDQLVKDWEDAESKIAEAFKHSALLTRAQINDLHELRAALKAVQPRTPGAPLSLSELGSQVNMGGLIDRGGLKGLDPRQFLGGQMDFRPTPMAKPGIGAKLGQMAQSGAGAAGGVVGEMMQGIAMFGPLGAVMPIITAAFEALAPVLEPLVPIIKALGEIIAVSLKPTIQFVVTALSYLAEALGWVIRGVGRLVDALPGISAKGVINAGQSLIDAARAARRNSDATDKATDAVEKFAGALSNIPHVLNINLLRHLLGGGSVTTGGTSTGGGAPGTAESRVGNVGGIIINVYEARDARKTAEAVGREVEWRFSRGGTNRLAAALK